MGNTSSSSCSCIPSSVSIGIFNDKNKTAMLLDTDGNIREIKLPVKSAELMIEAIGHIITPAEEIRKTRRITALPADEELVAKKVYLLVPVSRINSKASEFEIAIAEEKGKRRRRGIKTARVSPSPGSKLTEKDEEKEVAVLPPFVVPTMRMGNQRRWNPVLEPICESS